MRFGFVISLFMLLATFMAPAHAFPSSVGGACDIGRVTKHSKTGSTQNTIVQVSAASVLAGGTTTITLSNANTGFTGFLLYVNSPGATGAAAHAGQLASVGQAAASSVSCNNGPAAGTTVAHNSAAAKRTLSWTWTAPTQPGAYRVTALVAESANGVPALLNVAPVTITVAAAAPATTAPTKAPTLPPTTKTPTLPPPAPTSAPATPTTAPSVPTTAPRTPTSAPATPTSAPAPPTDAPAAPTDAPAAATDAPAAPTDAPNLPPPPPPPPADTFNMVLVRLQAVLDGTGTVSQLKAAIQNLMAQIQSAIQKAKQAKGTANANKPVKMIVTKAPPAAAAQQAAVAAAAAAAGASNFDTMNVLVGFADSGDAALFATLVTEASSPDAAVRSQSTLITSGDLASQIQAHPNGVDTTTGQVAVTEAQQVALVTCPDGTQVTQDMMAVLCPAAAAAPAPAAPAAAAGPAVPLSNGAFIGIIAGGVVLLLVVVGGLMYYQKAKSKSTSVAPRV